MPLAVSITIPGIAHPPSPCACRVYARAFRTGSWVWAYSQRWRKPWWNWLFNGERSWRPPTGSGCVHSRSPTAWGYPSAVDILLNLTHKTGLPIRRIDSLAVSIRRGRILPAASFSFHPAMSICSVRKRSFLSDTP